MRNIHNGLQGGRGRKDWGPDQQHRHNPTKKNAIAFELLERAEACRLNHRYSEGKGALPLSTAIRRKTRPSSDSASRLIVILPMSNLDVHPTISLYSLWHNSSKTSFRRRSVTRKNEDHAIDYAETLEKKAGVAVSTDEDEVTGDDESGPSDGGGKGAGGDDDLGDDNVGGLATKAGFKNQVQQGACESHQAVWKRKAVGPFFHSVTSISAKSHPKTVSCHWSLGAP